VLSSDIVAIRPFVPSLDFAVSKRFYQALGFRVTMEDETIAMLKLGIFSFILQKFYLKEHSENFMMQMLVRDVDAWWDEAQPARLTDEFGLKLVKPPAMQPWGMKVGFIADPSGVLWHIGEVLF
jgi:uncharacterized glyoxalase superfamily protein PhnB